MSKIIEGKVIKEFINADGTMGLSKMHITNPKVVSNLTTDDAISQSRQGMVWMNYRRFYGESGEDLPFADVADACSKDPKKFYDFLQDKGQEKEFEKYFTLELNEYDNLAETISDIVSKKYKYGFHEKIDLTMEDVTAKEPMITKKLGKILEFINTNFSDDEKKVVSKYINETLNG